MARMLRVVVVLCVAFALGREAAASPYAFVANEDSRDLTVVDLATNTVRATVPLGVGPADVVVSADGRSAYVVADATLVVVDTRTFTTSTIALPLPGATGVALHPDGVRVFISYSAFAQVSLVTPSNSTLSSVTLPSPSIKHIAMSPLGDFLYAVTGGGDILQLDVRTNTSRRLFSGGEIPSPSGVIVDSFGSVWLGSIGNQNVKVFSVAVNGNPFPLSNVTSGFRPGRIGLDRANGFGSVILVTNPDGAEVRRYFGNPITVPNAAKPRDADASADRVIVIANGRDASGVAPPGFGSVSIVPPAGAAVHLPGGDDPVAVSVGRRMWPEITLAPSPVLLGASGGTTVSRSVTVSASGWDALAVGAARITGVGAAVFGITNNGCSSRSVAVGGTCTLTVTFTAPGGLLARGTYSATLEVSSNAQGMPTATVPLSGRVGLFFPAPLPRLGL